MNEFEQYQQQLMEDQQQKQQKIFIESIEGKAQSQLSLQQLCYLGQNHRLVYENLVSIKGYTVPKLFNN